MPEFLLEVGCEEIPARMIDAAADELVKRVGGLLSRERLGADASLQTFSTPRRLAVLASGVALSQPDIEEQVMGPSLKVAYKDGQPGPPAHAFAKKIGMNLAEIGKVTTPKGEYLSATVKKKGRAASEILAEALPKEIGGIYWPKNMYWSRPSERFVRPVRWLVALIDDQVVPLEFDGVQAGNMSRGHRVIGETLVEIGRAQNYVASLKSAKVLGREERLQAIRKALDAAARKIPGARWRENASLVDTVVNLTEYPSVILGNFDREFLALPDEVLVTVMRDHQKYFALEDPEGKLLPHFLAVLNTEGDPHGIVQHGNERVLRARFNDARFFWETDQKNPLRDRGVWLKHVTFQKDLGSYYEKTLRVQRLCSWLCEILRDSGMAVRPGVVHKAAYLAKTDLTTELVKEFTELQGVVGGLYARVQQLDSDLPEATRFAIADAIYDQYKPESMEDSVPRTTEGALLSIGDKADSIAGMFGLGMIPSGSKDPFALRRQANGIVRIIAEHKLPIPISRLFQDARAAYQGTQAEQRFIKGNEYEEKIREFFRERLEFYLRDAQGYKYDVVNAVLAAGSDDVVDALARAEAISKLRGDNDFESVCAAFTRIRGILQQAAEKKLHVRSAFQFDESDPSEQQFLAKRVEEVKKSFRELQSRREYSSALHEFSELRPQIDAFFDRVMVMVSDDHVRSNRLALLEKVRHEFSSIADFSEIVTEGKS